MGLKIHHPLGLLQGYCRQGTYNTAWVGESTTLALAVRILSIDLISKGSFHPGPPGG